MVKTFLGDSGLGEIPSVKDILSEFEKARKMFIETKSVKRAMEISKINPHEVLRICAEEKLKSMGYKIISREETPEWIKSVGSPDIVAVKDREYILAEVKPSDQLKRYSKAKAKLILITDIETGKDIEVWGIKELEDH